MGIFRRNAASAPGGIPAAELERFGRSVYDPVENRWPWPSAATDLIVPMYQRYQAGPDQFLAALADIAETHGGWAAYGAERLMIEVAGNNRGHAAYARIMGASLSFLRSRGVPPKMVTGYEWNHWIDSGGDNETWVPRRPTPSEDDAPISPLAPGETRRLAQLFASSDSNVFLVRKEEDGRYAWIVDARYSDEDPRRTRRVQRTAESLHNLYANIGLTLQVPPYWHDRELEPYIPLSRPALD